MELPEFLFQASGDVLIIADRGSEELHVEVLVDCQGWWEGEDPAFGEESPNGEDNSNDQNWILVQRRKKLGNRKIE